MFARPPIAHGSQQRPSAGAPSLRWQIVFPAILSLVAAVLGAVGGGLIAAQSSNAVETTQVQQQLSAEARTDRTGAYLAILTSGDQVSQTREALWECYSARPAKSIDQSLSVCAAQLSAANAAITDFVHKQDALFIYGTDGAVNLAQQILDGDARFYDRAGVYVSNVDLNQEGLYAPYPTLRDAFRRQMCRDLNPLPRPIC